MMRFGILVAGLILALPVMAQKSLEQLKLERDPKRYLLIGTKHIASGAIRSIYEYPFLVALYELKTNREQVKHLRTWRDLVASGSLKGLDGKEAERYQILLELLVFPYPEMDVNKPFEFTDEVIEAIRTILRRREKFTVKDGIIRYEGAPQGHAWTMLYLTLGKLAPNTVGPDR